MNMMDLDEAIKEVDEMGTNTRTISNDSGSGSGGDGGISVSPTATASHTPYPHVITIDVGGRKYKTFTATLRAESDLFRVQISDYFTWEPEPDGSYFLDADPDLFEHLLRFMRRPNVFPLFYTKATGFDYDLYNRLEVEAEYFQMGILHAWIKEKKYLNAIITKTDQPSVMNLKSTSNKNCAVNESVDRYMLPRIEKVYVCPRDIFVHRGNPDACGATCRKAQADAKKKFDKET